MNNQLIIDLVIYIAGCYEVISRAIPSKGNWSIVHNVLNVLLVVSKYLDNKKYQKPE